MRKSASLAGGVPAARGLDLAAYIEGMFKTGDDEANRVAVTAEGMPLVGLAVHGTKNAVDKTLKGLPPHP